MISQEEFYMEVKKKWKSLYPAYFDKTKTIAQGRKVPRSLAIDSPSLQEIILALSEVQVRWIVEEHKSYSKDWATNGRLKVEVLNDQRNPVNPKIANKKALLAAVGQRLVSNRQRVKENKGKDTKK